MVRVSVEDTGIGLSKEARDGLFQPFKQAQRLAGGTGLGLFSLSKRIESLGGLCGVNERKDGKRGSLFWFSFPYRPTEGSLEEDISSQEIKHLSKGLKVSPCTSLHKTASVSSIDSSDYIRTNGFCVLVVDDSPFIVKATERALKQKGFRVSTANNGSAGLDLLTKGYALKDFDLVLMDLQMPVMDGIEAVRRYREFEVGRWAEEDYGLKELDEEAPIQMHRKKLPIIGMSANSDNATRIYALEIGMSMIIPKPFVLKDLLPIMDSLLSDEKCYV